MFLNYIKFVDWQFFKLIHNKVFGQVLKPIQVADDGQTG